MTDQPLPRLFRYTPLRYPGGKSKLAPFLKKVIVENGLSDCVYVEAYAGGAGIALELLFQEFVSRIHINDASLPMFSFWKSVIRKPEQLCRMIVDTPVTLDNWNRCKQVFHHATEHDYLTLGFATFFLNRTNRSGILNGGVIGGRLQTGKWKIDARYNARELARRVSEIAKFSAKISLSGEDAYDFISSGIREWNERTLIYCDPPYYVKGRDLYYDYYQPEDHEEISSLMTSVTRQKWVVSYDNVAQVHHLYSGFQSITYTVGYSARSRREGSEVMFFCDDLVVPALAGTMKPTSAHEPNTTTP
jgi:DNA adenine methylase